MGMVIGVLLAVPLIALQEIIAPWGAKFFGSSWHWIRHLLFFAFLGWVVKLLIWKRFPTDFSVDAMTPEEFAGATPEAVQWQKQRATERTPLPEVAPTFEIKADKPDLALDFAQLERRAAELKALGFVVVKEGALRTASHSVPIYGRFFSHADGCFAELSQIFMPAAHHPLFVSLNTRFPNRWLASDSTMHRNVMLWIMRRQRGIGKRHGPDTSISVMWQSHRERCAYVSQVLQQPALRLSYDEYISESIADLKEMRPLALKRSVWLGLVSYLLSSRNAEGWGELEPPATTVANRD